MRRLSRRSLLMGTTRSAVALSLRAAITGLPLSFLLRGEARASDPNAKVTILSCSSAGEAVNVCGPGTYEPGMEDVFNHPQAGEVDASEVGTVVVNGVGLTAEHLENGALVSLGEQVVTMASAFEALPAELLQHMVYFQHRTNAGIHPEFPAVLMGNGKLHNADGRGAEQLPSAIAQETAALLGTTMQTPFVLGGGNFTSAGAPLPSYSPLQAKKLANSVGQTLGGPANFGALFDYYMDRTYAAVKANGTAEQKRFLDQHASSRAQAAAFGADLGQLLEDIVDNSYESELKAAVAIAKLKLAPVVVTGFRFSGDNHSDFDLTIESAYSLRMIKALDSYWQAATTLGVQDDILYATSTVFGRDCRRKGGRGHDRGLCSGIVIGSHVKGGVVGGIDASSGTAMCTGFNSQTGESADPDVLPDETLSAYYRSLMMLAGVAEERRKVRLPTGTDVVSLIGS